MNPNYKYQLPPQQQVMQGPYPNTFPNQAEYQQDPPSYNQVTQPNYNAGPSTNQQQMPMPMPPQPGMPPQLPMQGGQMPTAPPFNANDDEGKSDDEPEMVDPGFNQFTNFNGYGNMSDKGKAIDPPPPITPNPVDKEKMLEMSFDNVDHPRTDEDCREALLEFTTKHCCYGKGVVRNMVVNRITPSNALHYILETYAESRITNWAFKPYLRDFVDSPQNGTAPLPWEIPCRADSLFVDEVKKIVVPHTEEIRPCHTCQTCGTVICPRCRGRGRIRCSSCHGSGSRSTFNSHSRRHQRRSCMFCHGSGSKICTKCTGSCRIVCPSCQGHCQLKCKNFKSDYIHETTDMPDHLVRESPGKDIFKFANPIAWPISNYPLAVINENSRRLVDTHRRNYNQYRILRERQTLRVVPVTEISYNFKSESKRFWIYGADRKVHCTDYPQKCCWGCNVL